MSGICAVGLKQNPPAMRDALATVGRSLALANSERLTERSYGAGGVAVSSAFGTQEVYSNDRLLLACDADLYDEGNGSIGVAARLARLYELHGSDFVRDLRGAFS